MRLLSIFPSAIVLSSCLLGPTPAAPQADTPASIRNGGPPAAASFGTQPWQSVFADPTLQSLIDRALGNNPDLVAATYRIEEAQALSGRAHAALFPLLSGSTGATSNYGSSNLAQGLPGGSRRSESYDLSGFLTWEIDLWGGIRRGNQAARARFLQASYQREAVKTLLIAAVASAYIDLKNLDERLAISRRTSQSRKTSFDLVTTRRDGGVSSDLEVGQAEALLGQARISIPLTEQAITAKENEIRSLLGEFPGAVVRGGSLSRLENTLRISGGLPAALLERRPDVVAAAQSYEAATADIGVAQALRFPTLSLTGRGGLVSADLSNLLEGRSGTYSIGPQLAGPLFDAGRLGFGVKAAQARAQQLRAVYDKTSQQAFREAADALNAHQKTGEIIAERTRLVNSLKGVASVAQDRFQGGASSYLEVLDAERSLFTAELDLADSRRDRLQSVVQAYRALGGGWK
jgi:outer membrane protein, multidrug efflux system